MLRSTLLAVLQMLAIFPQAFSQENRREKLLVDSNAYGSWPMVGGGISNDGRYLYCSIHDPVNTHDTLRIRSVEKNWSVEYLDGQNPSFTQDGKDFIFQRHDSIVIIDLNARTTHFLSGILGNCQLLPIGKDKNRLGFRLKEDPEEFVICEVEGSEAGIKIPFAAAQWYNASSGYLLFDRKDPVLDSFTLKGLDLNTGAVTDYWKGGEIQNLLFAEQGDGFIFVSKQAGEDRSIWYCDLKNVKAAKIASDDALRMDPDLRINDILGINQAGTHAFFTVVSKTPKKVPGLSVDVYSYKDAKLQSEQLNELKKGSPEVYNASVNLKDGKIIRLTFAHEKCVDQRYASKLPNKWGLLIQDGQGGNAWNEWNWNHQAKRVEYLYSLDDGSRKPVCIDTKGYRNFYTSPDEKYIVYYDPDLSNYCSFEVATGRTVSITTGIKAKWTMRDRDDEPASKYYVVGISGFTKDGHVLLNSQYDLFEADISGKTTAVNLTMAYGQRHHVVFTVARDENIQNASGSVLLDAFNTETKDRGFYRISLNGTVKLDSLTMRASFVYLISKSRDGNGYIVMISDANTSPNYYFSSDLKHFDPITNVHPESKYNWVTSELVNYRLPDGRSCQGVLYIPENLDPARKYPLIFYYYELNSDMLHEVKDPGTTSGYLMYDLAHYVSNGFLVFMPDIHYTIGAPGRSAYNSVMSALDVLKKRPYVNTKKMGLQGASFGGFETNYIISHTSLFAAAVADCSMTDFVSAYGSMIGDGSSRQRQYELYRDRMGGTLWEIPEKYIENSPVFRADKITTPVLLVANNNDGDVPHEQGIELFTALRRLGKKSWMLQYDGEGHGISGKRAQSDYTLRMFQFFSCLLKDGPPPKWMTEGVPATEKRYYSGMEVDGSGAKP